MTTISLSIGQKEEEEEEDKLKRGWIFDKPRLGLLYTEPTASKKVTKSAFNWILLFHRCFSPLGGLSPK